MLELDIDFEQSRNDKFHTLTIPTYSYTDDAVYYDIHLKDLMNGREYIRSFRFNDLKEYHELNQRMKLHLPEFPKTHLLKKTNKNPKMIDARRKILEKYFSIIINDPYARGTKEVKKFISACKVGLKEGRSLSCENEVLTTEVSRSRSMTRRLDDLAATQFMKDYS